MENWFASAYAAELTLLAAVMVAILATVRVLPARQAGVVERAGVYRRTIGRVGLVLPFVERLQRIDLVEHRLRLPHEPFRLGTGEQLFVEVKLGYRVVAPELAAYRVQNRHLAVEQATVHTLRRVLADLPERPQPGACAAVLQAELGQMEHTWGIEPTDVRLAFSGC